MSEEIHEIQAHHAGENGAAAILSRIIYVLVAISAIWCISLFFKDNRLVTEQ